MTRAEKIIRLEEQGHGFLRQANELREQERDEISRPKLREMVGKCFRYENSYGGTDAKHWPLYAKVISFNEREMTFNVVEFQHMADRRIEFRYERTLTFEGQSWIRPENGWTPIPASEFNRAYRRAKKFVENLFEKGKP